MESDAEIKMENTVSAEGAKVGDASAYTIGTFCNRSSASPGTVAYYREEMTRLEGRMGKPLADASGRDVERLKAELRKERSGPSRANLLRMFYRDAYRATDDRRFEKYVESLYLKQRIHRLGPEDILTLEEVDRILNAANDLKSRALVATLWAVGQRIGAVCALRLRDLKEDPETREYQAFFRTVKIAGQEHIAWVLPGDGGEHLRTWLAAYPNVYPDLWRDAGAPVFPSARGGGVLSESAAYRIVSKAAARAGIKKRVYPHLFRHSKATHLRRIGVPWDAIKRQMGWTPGSTVPERTYGHLTEADTRRELRKANGLPVPEDATVRKHLTEPAKLRAVVPDNLPPPAASPKESDLTLMGEIRNALTNPRVLEAIRVALLRTSKG